MYDELKALIVAKFPVSASSISKTATLEEIGLNSMDAVELAAVVTDELRVPISDDEVFELDRLDRIAALLERRRVEMPDRLTSAE